MSPPVLGTLLALCVGMILPHRVDGVSSELPRVPISGALADQVAVQLDHGMPGLCGLYINMHPNTKHLPQNPSCGGCSGKFGDGYPVYLWKTRSSQIKCFHEVCMMVECGEENAEYWTLNHIRDMKARTDHELLLETLFKCEDDLTRDHVWEIDFEDGIVVSE